MHVYVYIHTPTMNKSLFWASFWNQVITSHQPLSPTTSGLPTSSLPPTRSSAPDTHSRSREGVTARPTCAPGTRPPSPSTPCPGRRTPRSSCSRPSCRSCTPGSRRRAPGAYRTPRRCSGRGRPASGSSSWRRSGRLGRVVFCHF